MAVVIMFSLLVTCGMSDSPTVPETGQQQTEPAPVDQGKPPGGRQNQMSAPDAPGEPSVS